MRDRQLDYGGGAGAAIAGAGNWRPSGSTGYSGSSGGGSASSGFTLRPGGLMTSLVLLMCGTGVAGIYLADGHASGLGWPEMAAGIGLAVGTLAGMRKSLFTDGPGFLGWVGAFVAIVFGLWALQRVSAGVTNGPVHFIQTLPWWSLLVCLGIVIASLLLTRERSRVLMALGWFSFMAIPLIACAKGLAWLLGLLA